MALTRDFIKVYALPYKFFLATNLEDEDVGELEFRLPSKHWFITSITRVVTSNLHQIRWQSDILFIKMAERFRKHIMQS
jgi:hypothetical protein